MNWLTAALGSSVGKKLMMALTGLAFTGFLAGHLAGNLTIYSGRAAFNGYAEKLHSLGPLLKLVELGLIIFAAVHILTGLWLFLQNRKARPVRYTLDASAGGRTLSSRTMPYTGLDHTGLRRFSLWPTSPLRTKPKPPYSTSSPPPSRARFTSEFTWRP